MEGKWPFFSSIFSIPVYPQKKIKVGKIFIRNFLCVFFQSGIFQPLSHKKRFFSEKKKASIVLLFRFCFFFASFHTNSNFVCGKFCLASER
jgi:hypothetical protein